MTKTPTRSPTHEEVDPTRLASMGLELEDIADGDTVALPALVELAEDRGRPASHYLAALPLATELRLAGPGDRPLRAEGALAATGDSPEPLIVKVCAGTCQRWGALDLLDHLAERAARDGRFVLAPVSCLDRCDHAPAAEVHGVHGVLVVAPATGSALDEAVKSLG